MEDSYSKSCTPLTPEQKLRFLAIRRGIRYEQDCVEWCDEALAVIREID